MFESLIMQTTGNLQIADITALIIAVGGIATAIGGFMKNNARLNTAGQYLTTFGQKTVEQEKNISAIGNAVVSLSPEAAAELAKQGKTIEELRRRAEIAEQQLAVLSPKIPEGAQADNVKQLPR